MALMLDLWVSQGYEIVVVVLSHEIVRVPSKHIFLEVEICVHRKYGQYLKLLAGCIVIMARGQGHVGSTRTWGDGVASCCYIVVDKKKLFSLWLYDSTKIIPCHCGVRNCRGFMNRDVVEPPPFAKKK